MLAADRDAVICDLAETYGIWDYKGLPVFTLATLCVGLRENSRIKMKMAGIQQSTDTVLRLATLDQLRMLVWMQSADGHKGRNRPKSLLDQTTWIEEEQRETVAYESGDQFLAARQRWIEGSG